MNPDSTPLPIGRDAQIALILEHLRGMTPSAEEQYAWKENIRFFEAARGVASYVQWVYSDRKRIDRQRLLEIYELLPEFDTAFHSRMAEVEREPRPGIIEPLVEALTDVVRKANGDRIRIASLGCGSMEAERQMLLRLPRELAARVTVVGFDISRDARAYAVANMTGAGAVVVAEEHLSSTALENHESEAGAQPLVIVSGNDIFTLLDEFGPGRFEVAMTALFLHHLPAPQRAELIALMRKLAPHSLNYDGYQSEIVVPIVSVTGWRYPVFLNAAIFSMIRFPVRTEAIALHQGASVEFFPHGHYRAVI